MNLQCPRDWKVRRADQGFTLIELLVVMMILAVLAVVTLAAMQGTLSSVDLKGSANTLASELDLARATAGSRNLAVDVRIYRDPNEKDASGNGVYRIIALVIPASDPNAADEYVSHPVALPEDVIFDSDPTYSSLLNPSASTTLPPIGGVESASAPSLVQNKPYVKFTFLSNGSLNLDSTVSWTLTLVNKDKVQATGGGPAANFATIVLSVLTGRSQIYQP